MANARYQLKADVYMPLNGQWQIVQSGTVFDDDITKAYATAHVVVLSPGEPAGSLGPHGKATSVRNVRTL
jgi:hypothetical protein